MFFIYSALYTFRAMYPWLHRAITRCVFFTRCQLVLARPMFWWSCPNMWGAQLTNPLPTKNNSLTGRHMTLSDHLLGANLVVVKRATLKASEQSNRQWSSKNYMGTKSCRMNQTVDSFLTSKMSILKIRRKKSGGKRKRNVLSLYKISEINCYLHFKGWVDTIILKWTVNQFSIGI